MLKFFASLTALIAFVQAPPALAAKEILNVGISAEFETLHPTISSQAATKYMLYLAYRPLIVLSLDGKWIPMLIKEVPTLENKLAKKVGEGLETTFDIRDDANWGDGTPVTCKDMLFTMNVGLNKNVSVPEREPYENISSITWDAKTPKRCVTKFKKAKYNYYNAYPDPLPSHLEESVFKKHSVRAEGYDQNTLYVKNPSNPGLYNGPYVISEVKLGSHVVFTPNPQWKGTPPSIKKIIFKLIPNGGTLEANLRSGNIDMVCPAGGLGPDQAVVFDKKVKSENLGFEVVFVDGYLYAHIDLNLDHPALADLRVRKALSMAFNKKEMIDSLLEGKGKVATSFAVTQDPWSTDKVPVYNYSRREAAKLLDEAGWKMGASGYREKNGKRLSLTLMAASGAKINELIETYIQSQYKAVGIELMVKNEPARVFFGETTTHRNFEMALFTWSSQPDNVPRSTLHSTSVPSAKNSWAGQNYTGYKNPEMDKLIDAAELELDTAKRIAIGQKILEIYARDIPVIPVYYRQVNSVIPKGMKGYRLSGHQFYESLYAENWAL